MSLEQVRAEKWPEVLEYACAFKKGKIFGARQNLGIRSEAGREAERSKPAPSGGALAAALPT